MADKDAETSLQHDPHLVGFLQWPDKMFTCQHEHSSWAVKSLQVNTRRGSVTIVTTVYLLGILERLFGLNTTRDLCISTVYFLIIRMKDWNIVVLVMRQLKMHMEEMHHTAICCINPSCSREKTHQTQSWLALILD